MKRFLLTMVIGLILTSCKKDEDKRAPNISFTVNARAMNAAAFALKPLSNSDGQFTFSSSDNSVATIDGNILTIKKVGTAVITASQAATKTYAESTATATFQVLNPGTFVLGQAINGGIVAYLDATGVHGFMLSDTDVAVGLPWSTGSITATSATAGGWGSGAANTDRIIAAIGDGAYAAKACREYRGGGYNDWYLPSQSELSTVRLRKDIIGGIPDTNYWTSNEVAATPANANFIYMGPGTLSGSNVTVNNYSKLYTYSVRAMRAF